MEDRRSLVRGAWALLLSMGTGAPDFVGGRYGACERLSERTKRRRRVRGVRSPDHTPRVDVVREEAHGLAALAGTSRGWFRAFDSDSDARVAVTTSDDGTLTLTVRSSRPRDNPSPPPSVSFLGDQFPAKWELDRKLPSQLPDPPTADPRDRPPDRRSLSHRRRARGQSNAAIGGTSIDGPFGPLRSRDEHRNGSVCHLRLG